MSAGDKVLSLDDGIEWRKMTSKNGVPFEIGFKKVVGVVKEKSDSGTAEPSVASKDSFGITVRWVVGDSYWKSTSDDIKATAAITRYCLVKDDDFLAPYTLHFTNTEHYDYTFHDETGDEYGCDTWTNGDHYFRYQSKRPTIVYVRGK